uniref:uncharacterized protein LOC106992536 n=1 Tax=Macaca mulatta TaxID=9544 RepID=UPI0010A26620|nr:uncharacterized protein LOC106992536 [Macaca mulatta]
MSRRPAFAGPVLPRGPGLCSPSPTSPWESSQQQNPLLPAPTRPGEGESPCTGRPAGLPSCPRASGPLGLGPTPDPALFGDLPPQDPFRDPFSNPRHGRQGRAFCMGRAPPAGRLLNLEGVALQIPCGSRRGPRCIPLASCARGCRKRCPGHPHGSDSSAAPTHPIFRPPCRWRAFACSHCAATASGAAAKVPASPSGSCVSILIGAQDWACIAARGARRFSVGGRCPGLEWILEVLSGSLSNPRVLERAWSAYLLTFRIARCL